MNPTIAQMTQKLTVVHGQRWTRPTGGQWSELPYLVINFRSGGAKAKNVIDFRTVEPE